MASKNILLQSLYLQVMRHVRKAGCSLGLSLRCQTAMTFAGASLQVTAAMGWQDCLFVGSQLRKSRFADIVAALRVLRCLGGFFGLA
jgi:hypothetical protein